MQASAQGSSYEVGHNVAHARPAYISRVHARTYVHTRTRDAFAIRCTSARRHSRLDERVALGRSYRSITLAKEAARREKMCRVGEGISDTGARCALEPGRYLSGNPG